MAQRSKAPPSNARRLSTFDRFLQMAPMLAEGMSFADIAKHLDVSVATIHNVLNALELRFSDGQVELAKRDDLPPKGSRLTPHGEELWERLRHVEEFDPTATTVALAVPHSILNSTRITGGIDRYFRELDGSDERLDLRLEVRDISQIDLLAEEVRNERLDIAIAWAVNERVFEKLKHDPKITAVSSKPIDVVIASHSTQKLQRLPPSVFDDSIPVAKRTDGLRRFLERERAVVMHAEAQPMRDALKVGIERKKAPARVRVGHIDAAICALAARAADYAIIPKLPTHLNQHQHSGSLCWSEPVGSMRMVLIARPRAGLRDTTLKFYDKLRGLIDTEGDFGKSTYIRSFRDFPRGPSEYEHCQFGYYIDADRLRGDGPRTATDEAIRTRSTHWQWEEMAIRRCLDGGPRSRKQKRVTVGHAADQLVFEGRIRNKLQDVFDLTIFVSDVAGGQSGGRIVAIAHKRTADGSNSSRSVDTFVTVLTRCIELDSGKLAFAGVWIGLNNSELPAAYANIWSQESLTQDQVVEISESVLTRPVQLADPASDFDKQPSSSTIRLSDE